MSLSNVQNLVDNLTYLNLTKQLIKNSIINKGQTINANTPFREYVNKITNISTGGENVDSYLFNSKNQMNSFSEANEGDYGVIWYANPEGIKTYGNYSNLQPMAHEIVFDNEVTTWTNGLTSNNGTHRITYNVGPTYLNISYSSSKYITEYTNYHYISSDNKTYILNINTSADVNDICDKSITIISNSYNPILEKLLILNYHTNFEGIYIYNNNWEPASTQLNTLVTNILGPKTAFVNNTITGNFTGSVINGLNNTAVINYFNTISPVVTNIQPMENYINTSQLFMNYRYIQHIPNIKSTNLYETFLNCDNLLYVNIETLPNEDTNCYLAFNSCYNLTSVKGNIYTSYPFGLFNSCYSLREVPNVHFLSSTINNAFRWCYSIKNLSSIDLSNVTYIKNCFCNGYFTSSMLSDMNFSRVTDITGLFSNFRFNVSNLDDINVQKITSLNCNNVTNMSYLYYCSNNLITAPNFETSNVLDSRYMFASCYNLTSVPNYNTINVKQMSYMFYYCENLTSVPNFNTSNVTVTSYMFYSCYNLTSVPNYNTVNVVEMLDMFGYCNSLTTAPNLNTVNVKTMGYMFYNCVSLTKVFQYNTSNVTTMQCMFYNCNKLTNASIQNIINMVLNSNITTTTYKNLSNTNSYSPFYNTNITSSRYSNRTSQLTAAGWTY